MLGSSAATTIITENGEKILFFSELCEKFYQKARRRCKFALFALLHVVTLEFRLRQFVRDVVSSHNDVSPVVD